MYQLNKLQNVRSVSPSPSKGLSSPVNQAKKDACSALRFSQIEQEEVMTWFEDDFSAELSHADQTWNQDDLEDLLSISHHVNDDDFDVLIKWK